MDLSLHSEWPELWGRDFKIWQSSTLCHAIKCLWLPTKLTNQPTTRPAAPTQWIALVPVIYHQFYAAPYRHTTNRSKHPTRLNYPQAGWLRWRGRRGRPKCNLTGDSFAPQHAAIFYIGRLPSSRPNMTRGHNDTTDHRRHPTLSDAMAGGGVGTTISELSAAEEAHCPETLSVPIYRVYYAFMQCTTGCTYEHRPHRATARPPSGWEL